MAVLGLPEWLRVGNLVELRSDEPGYSGAWFVVKVISIFPDKRAAWVEYRDFVEDKKPGSKHIRELGLFLNLRPMPPAGQTPKVWRVRDSVETNHKDAWWCGYIKDVGSKSNSYRIWYGHHQDELDIPARNIRARQVYRHPSPKSPNGSWVLARAMQNPPVWETAEPAPESPKPVPAPLVGNESDDEWNAHEERRPPKKKPRMQRQRQRQRQNKSKSALAKSQAEPKKKIGFVKFPKTITQALPAINVPFKPSEQTIVCLTPGSSPPLVDSPLQDSILSPGSDSKAQNLFANPEASPMKFSSNSSRGRSSGSSDFSSSDDKGDASSEDNDTLTHTEVFHDFSHIERTTESMTAYRMLLTCFRNDSKGLLDKPRHDILRSVRRELNLTIEQCNQAHCAVFGLGLP